jgi:hypothetical protein
MTTQQQLRAYVDYLRDMGVYDLYRRDDPSVRLPDELLAQIATAQTSPAKPSAPHASIPKPAAQTAAPFQPRPSAPTPAAPSYFPQAAASSKAAPPSQPAAWGK